MTVHKSSFPSSLPAVQETVQYISYSKVSESFTFTSISRVPSQYSATNVDPAFCRYPTPAHEFHNHSNTSPVAPGPCPNIATSVVADERPRGLTPQPRPTLTPHRGESPRHSCSSHWTFYAVLRACWCTCAPLCVEFVAHAVVFALLAGASAFACASAGYVFLTSKEPYRSSNRDSVLCMSGAGGAAAGLAIFTFCSALAWVTNWKAWKGPTDVSGEQRGSGRVGGPIIPFGLLLAVAAGGLFGAYIGVHLPGGGLSGGLDEVHAFQLGVAGVMTVAEGLVLLVACPLYAYRSSWTREGE
ncbi:hypothetical protein C8Q72DRAFT_103770 [Fomitopsis betulina]|nr:hypothetical protein C8Q72DRAFT_103770 [Fomitopsis betulina]